MFKKEFTENDDFPMNQGLKRLYIDEYFKKKYGFTDEDFIYLYGLLYFDISEIVPKYKKGQDNFFYKRIGGDSYIITIKDCFNYNILIEISPNHKNYHVFKNIGYFLNKTNNTWEWLLIKANIQETTMKSYLSGKEYVTLKTIEKIVSAFDGIINSPRKLMNLEYPVLKGGSDFKLNIYEIMIKYRINRGDLSLATGIDNGLISNYFNGVIKQIRIETIIKFFNYFKGKGVPLNNHADLIYFPNHGEIPLHFMENIKDKNFIP